MQDATKIAQQMIKALQNAANANIGALNVQRENVFEGITNQRNARGTLYSSGTGYQQLRADAETFQPAIAEQRQKAFMGEIQIKSDLLDTKRKIDAINRSAKELAGIKFDGLLD